MMVNVTTSRFSQIKINFLVKITTKVCVAIHYFSHKVFFF